MKKIKKDLIVKFQKKWKSYRIIFSILSIILYLAFVMTSNIIIGISLIVTISFSFMFFIFARIYADKLRTIKKQLYLDKDNNYLKMIDELLSKNDNQKAIELIELIKDDLIAIKAISYVNGWCYASKIKNYKEFTLSNIL